MPHGKAHWQKATEDAWYAYQVALTETIKAEQRSDALLANYQKTVRQALVDLDLNNTKQARDKFKAAFDRLRSIDQDTDPGSACAVLTDYEQAEYELCQVDNERRTIIGEERYQYLHRRFG